MRKQKTTLFFAFVAGACLMAAIFFAGCNDEKKSSTTETRTDTMVTPVTPATPDTIIKMDTGSTKPIVPGT